MQKKKLNYNYNYKHSEKVPFILHTTEPSQNQYLVYTW